jgi:hypothetical protein
MIEIENTLSRAEIGYMLLPDTMERDYIFSEAVKEAVKYSLR